MLELEVPKLFTPSFTQVIHLCDPDRSSTLLGLNQPKNDPSLVSSYRWSPGGEYKAGDVTALLQSLRDIRVVRLALTDWAQLIQDSGGIEETRSRKEGARRRHDSTSSSSSSDGAAPKGPTNVVENVVINQTWSAEQFMGYVASLFGTEPTDLGLRLPITNSTFTVYSDREVAKVIKEVCGYQRRWGYQGPFDTRTDTQPSGQEREHRAQLHRERETRRPEMNVGREAPTGRVSALNYLKFECEREEATAVPTLKFVTLPRPAQQDPKIWSNFITVKPTFYTGPLYLFLQIANLKSKTSERAHRGT